MIAFMVALQHTQDNTLWSHLCNYSNDDTPIIMAKETSKKSHQDISGQHFHVYIGWEDKTWEAFKKTILIKKLQLRGKANDKLARQYGRVTKIKDQQKMIAYTIKCNNYKFKNFDKDYLNNVFNNESYEKEEKLDYQETLMKHLLAVRDKFVTTPDQTDDNPVKVYQLAEEILLHHMEQKDKPICRTKLCYYISYYLQCIEPLRMNKKMRDNTLSIILRGI